MKNKMRLKDEITGRRRKIQVINVRNERVLKVFP
jgi:hypothetical protein